MSNKLYLSISALVGIVCGFITSHTFFSHSWTSIFLWVGVGIPVIYFSRNRRSGIYAATIYGFLTIAVWLITGFNGTSDKILQLSMIILIASSLCAAIGALGAVIFYKLFRRDSGK